MPMVVTQRCAGCKFKDCIVVCPADCFYEGETMLYINPDECIDCGLCAPECPQQAIFYDDRIPSELKADIALNRKMSHECPRVSYVAPSAGRSSSAQS